MWISGNRNLDVLIFHLSGIIGLLFYFILKDNHLAFLFYGFFVTQILDAGHNYVSSWRTFFKRVTNRERFYYFLMVVFCFFIILLWLILKIPYFWEFFLYFTFFHHVRQYYGICRWYQKLNNRFCRASNFFLYSLTITPFILYHFRTLPQILNFPKISLFQYPSQILFLGGLVIYFLFFLGWIFNELKLYKNGFWEINRFLSILMPCLLHFYCFIISIDFLQTIFPLFIAHGLSYIFIMGFTLGKLEKNTLPIIYLVFFSAILFGFGDYLYRLLLLHENYNYLTFNGNSNFIILAIITTPAIFHYFSDGLIWTGKSKDMKLLFTKG